MEKDDSKREEVIHNARTNWELLRSKTTKQLLGRHSSSLKDLRREDTAAPLSARAVHLPETMETKRAMSQQVVVYSIILKTHVVINNMCRLKTSQLHDT